MSSVAGRTVGDTTLRRFSRYLPLILWMALIAFASTGQFSAANTSRILGPFFLWLFPDISPERLVTLHSLARKGAHFAEYFLLGLLAARAFGSSGTKSIRKFWFRWAMLLVVVYALLDEYHQTFVPSRSASIYDCLIDIGGGLTAILVYLAWLNSSWKPQKDLKDN